MSDRKVPDYLANHSESNQLARTIKQYWADRGLDVRTWVQREVDPIEHWVVRSNLTEVLAQ